MTGFRVSGFADLGASIGIYTVSIEVLRRDAGEGNVIDEGSCLGFERYWSAGIEYGCFEEWEGRYERCATGCLAWKGVFCCAGSPWKF